MTWILWVTFTFAQGPTLAYPLEIYNNELDCRDNAFVSAVMYKDFTPKLFPKMPEVKVRSFCTASAKT